MSPCYEIIRSRHHSLGQASLKFTSSGIDVMITRPRYLPTLRSQYPTFEVTVFDLEVTVSDLEVTAFDPKMIAPGPVFGLTGTGKLRPLINEE